MALHFTPSLEDVPSSWEEDRKFILRGWSLTFSVVAAIMMLSVSDGRMAYVEGSYTGYLGFWTNCRRNKCANVGQVTILIHLGAGFMMLALGLCLLLVPCMGFSFRPSFRRLAKMDLIFSFLSVSIGLLIFLSLMLFTINCHKLRPKPQVSYLVTFYLCWGASALMLWAGALSYLNHVGMWQGREPTVEWQMSNRRRASRRVSRQPSSDNFRESVVRVFGSVNRRGLLATSRSLSASEDPSLVTEAPPPSA